MSSKPDKGAAPLQRLHRRQVDMPQNRGITVGVIEFLMIGVLIQIDISDGGGNGGVDRI